ncbi:endonuclease/exonuclease/phosphatase family protein [Nonomuraea longicatena]|uniref:Endonuclease/exonuclease/phosphatase domain-containing protein n=1 Tax=Nonomuraea longicatena TaxID=83682 RepID=A0ABP4AIV7_9ACTN
MITHAASAALLALTGLTAPAPTLTVMTWNVCAGTNSVCPLYGGTAEHLAESVGGPALAAGAEVVFLQESCTSAGPALEAWLERRSGRAWSVRSVALTAADGTPYACHPDQAGRPRGAQGVTVAVADPAATFQTHALESPPWFVRRFALCATLPAKRVHACGTHLSVGHSYDDRQAGAPYRTRQIKGLLGVVAKPGHLSVFGGDLNVSPPDSGYGAAAGRRAVAPAYRLYQECDQDSGRRTGRWTHTGTGPDGLRRKKLDYLFAPRGAVRSCGVDKEAKLSDHRAVYLTVSLPRR